MTKFATTMKRERSQIAVATTMTLCTDSQTKTSGGWVALMIAKLIAAKPVIAQMNDPMPSFSLECRRASPRSATEAASWKRTSRES